MAAQTLNRTACTCQVCGVIFFLEPSRVAWGRGKHCSRACAGAAKAQQYKGQPGPNAGKYKNPAKTCETCGTVFRKPTTHCTNHCRLIALGKRVRRECVACGKEFFITGSRAQHRPSIYCSNTCRQTCAVDATCAQCGTHFHIKPYKLQAQQKIYCSQLCHYAAMKREITEPCEYCGKLLTRKQSAFRKGTNQHVFCNAICTQAFRFRNSKQFRFQNYGRNRQRYREVFGSKCFICGYKRWIEYAHILPVRDGGKATKDNLVALCPNHHRLFDRGLLNEEEKRILSARVTSLSCSVELLESVASQQLELSLFPQKSRVD